MFLDHDETHKTSMSYDFSNSRTNGRVIFLFIIVGLVIQMVIQLFFTPKLIVFEVKTGILRTNIFARSSLQCLNRFLLYVFNCFFFSFGNAQLNMNGRMNEQECINCLISKMRTHLPMICFSHSVTKG